MPVIDLHVHLAGMGTGGSGCALSPRMAKSPVTWFMLRRAGIGRALRPHADASFAEHLVSLAEQSQDLDYACLFAMDGVYDAQGELDLARSHLLVPNAHLFEVCTRSRRLLPVISINPARRDALAELERWGPLAVALKWLAPLQRFDASEARFRPFLAKVKELELPLIVHTGCEHTFPGMVHRLGDPALYEPALAMGIAVVFSHCGSGSLILPGYDYTRTFLDLLERYDHAFGDTAAFGTLVRAGAMRRARRFAGQHADRILHGSDYPVPSNALYFLPELGFGRVADLEGVSHPLDRDLRLKRAMGFPEASFSAAHRLLAKRIARWEAYRDALPPTP